MQKERQRPCVNNLIQCDMKNVPSQFLSRILCPLSYLVLSLAYPQMNLKRSFTFKKRFEPILYKLLNRAITLFSFCRQKFNNYMTIMTF